MFATKITDFLLYKVIFFLKQASINEDKNVLIQELRQSLYALHFIFTQKYTTFFDMFNFQLNFNIFFRPFLKYKKFTDKINKRKYT